jgi:peroxiredoxin Q/BCP
LVERPNKIDAMRLHPGTPAPRFETEDFLGTPVRLAALLGKPVLLSFYRYASCPLCNLRVRELMGHQPELEASGLVLVGVFQSPRQEIARHVGRQDATFPLVPDPSMDLYRRYGVERSPWAMLSGRVIRDALRAMRAGFRPGRIDGPLDRLPADFLIAPDGTVAIAYYAEHQSDHLPVEEIKRWLSAPAGASDRLA